MGAILKKIVILLKENWSHMDNFKGAMLMKIVILLKENWSHMDKFSIYFKIFRDANSWGAMRQEMAIFKGGNSVCRVQMFFRSFHFIFRKKYTAGGDASENCDFQSRKQRLQGPFFQELSFYIQKELTNDFFQINFENALRPVENQGDDATENDNFQSRKQRLQGVQKFQD